MLGFNNEIVGEAVSAILLHTISLRVYGKKRSGGYCSDGINSQSTSKCNAFNDRG
jgi:hypothetical protein